jgi:hypothetical protein
LDPKKLGRIKKTTSLISKNSSKFDKKGGDLKKRISNKTESTQDMSPSTDGLSPKSKKVTLSEKQISDEKTLKLSQNYFERSFGPITCQKRWEKIYKFMVKKRQRNMANKYTYKCRQDVAEKRLRIKGRFVTRDQAF